MSVPLRSWPSRVVGHVLEGRLGGSLDDEAAQDDTPVNPGLLILKEIDLLAAKANTLYELQEAVGLVARGLLRAVVSQVLPLEPATEAHRLLEERRAAGRVVLRMP